MPICKDDAALCSGRRSARFNLFFPELSASLSLATATQWSPFWYHEVKRSSVVFILSRLHVESRSDDQDVSISLVPATKSQWVCGTCTFCSVR